MWSGSSLTGPPAPSANDQSSGDAERQILIAVRNGASVDRGMVVVHLFDADPRVRVSWVLQPGSAYARTIEQHLHANGLNVLQWDVAKSRDFHLIIAPYAHKALSELNGPIITITHGAGNRRLTAPNDLDISAVSGLDRSQLMTGNTVVPRVIGLASDHARHVLAAACPEAIAQQRGRVIGDVVADLLRDNQDRDLYFRQFFRLKPTQRLLVISSTWGPGLRLQDPRLVRRVLAELPVDRYRVALILHPNIWDEHGRKELERQLHDELDSGLLLLQWDSGWMQAILGADLLLGDQGSVTYYAASLGTPVILGCGGPDDLDRTNPWASLERVVRSLDPRRSLADQFEDAIAHHDRDAVQAHTEQILGARGKAWQALRAETYSLMDLPEPDKEAYSYRIADPRVPEPRLPASYRFQVTVQDSDRPCVRIRRYPAATADADVFHARDDFHLLSTDHETNIAVKDTAAIRIRTTRQSFADAHTEVTTKAARTATDSSIDPRMIAAAVTTGQVIAGFHRDERFKLTVLATHHWDDEDVDSTLPVIALFGWLSTGNRILDRGLVLDADVGGGSFTVLIVPVRLHILT